jgi:hypothetical protein
MASNTLVTTQRSPEIVTQACNIEIPDLWALAQQIENGANFDNPEVAKEAAKAILDTWHLAHSLKNHIIRY